MELSVETFHEKSVDSSKLILAVVLRTSVDEELPKAKLEPAFNGGAVAGVWD